MAVEPRVDLVKVTITQGSSSSSMIVTPDQADEVRREREAQGATVIIEPVETERIRPLR